DAGRGHRAGRDAADPRPAARPPRPSPPAGKAVVGPLLAAEPLHVGIWSAGLKGVSDSLLGPLGEAFRDKAHPAEGRTAASVLRDYVGDRPDALADLLMDADAGQFAVLLPKVREHGAE